MNKLKKITIAMIIFAVCITVIPIPTQAASSKNRKAHKAYQTQLKKDKKKYCYGKHKLRYAYKDLNRDGIDELIVDATFSGSIYGGIYTYNGKVRRLFEVGDIYNVKYYTKRKVLYFYEPAPFDEYDERYYKFENGRYKLKCYAHGEIGVSKECYINGKKKSAKIYKSYIKVLTKGEKAKSISKLKWKKY